MSKLHSLALSIAAVAFATAASAQGGSGAVATLQVDKGVVMVSNGAEYVSASSGHALVNAERIMITQDGAATIRYNDGCQRTINSPGVYIVDGVCTPAGGWSPVGTTAAIIVGGAAVYTIVHNLNNDNNDHPQPISR